MEKLKASELRIGNVLNNAGQECFVMEIYKNNKVELGYFKDSIGFVRSLDSIDIKPIPLTEDWLLSFGIKRRFDNETCNLFDLDGYGELTQDAANRGQGFLSLANFVKEHGWWLDIQSRRTLKYVHELQNLFHANTGIELPFTP